MSSRRTGRLSSHLVGYGRYEGAAACEALERLYEVVRLYVNIFQPSMKLVSKERVGGKVKKRYNAATAPFQRVLDSPQVTDEVKEALHRQYLMLNPVTLIRQLHRAQAVHWQLSVVMAVCEQPAQTVS